MGEEKTNNVLIPMKLERLALWTERSLFTEQGEAEKGFMGYVKGNFEDTIRRMDNVAWLRKVDDSSAFHNEFEALFYFLESKAAGYVLRSLADSTKFCKDKLHEHIPYSFGRECWGWRVMTNEYVWYIALTPWNTKHSFMLYCYHRKMLMSALAKAKGLPETCYGVLIYTGECIRIRFGADRYEALPQFSNKALENRGYANEQNEASGITPAQVAAMENGVIYGWDSPYANPNNYDFNGHYCIAEMEG